MSHRASSDGSAAVTRVTDFRPIPAGQLGGEGEAPSAQQLLKELADDALDLWVFRVDRATPADWALLSDDERARAERLIIGRKRVQRVSARSALRRILAAYTGQHPAGLEFTYGEHDKPALVGADLSFNLSHSYDWAAVVVAKAGRVGVDVEFAARKREFAAVAERFFSPEERAYFAGLEPKAQPQAFYRAWTRKEAYLKAWGTGLSFASTGFCIDYAPGGPGRVQSTQMPDDRPEQWRFVDIEVAQDYPAALCWDRVPDRVRAFRLDAEPLGEALSPEPAAPSQG